MIFFDKKFDSAHHSWDMIFLHRSPAGTEFYYIPFFSNARKELWACKNNGSVGKNGLQGVHSCMTLGRKVIMNAAVAFIVAFTCGS